MFRFRYHVMCCGVLCCAGKRLVLAGAGLEHEQLVELATPMLKGKHTDPLAALSVARLAAIPPCF
jgi:hypothetical protein